MAYRAHVVALDITTGRALSLAALRSEETARGGRLGHIGTRYGVPGIWIETERAAGFFASLERACRVLRAEGRRPVVHTTNIPSQTAAEPLRALGISVLRG